MTRKRKQGGIRRCRDCGEIIFMDGEPMPGSTRQRCRACNYIGVGCGPPSRQIDADIHDMAFYSDLDEFDSEILGDDPDFNLEDYLE